MGVLDIGASAAFRVDWNRTRGNAKADHGSDKDGGELLAVNRGRIRK
jgi:hypothetical protein